MEPWSTYRLDDFLLFSPRVYWRLFEAQNAALWPLHLATMLAGLALVLLILRRPGRAMLWTGLLLAPLWAFVAWSFLLQRYAGINWAMDYAAPAFFLQAVLLLAAAVMPGGPALGRRDAVSRAGLGLAVAGLLPYPALALASGRPLTMAEVFGIAPDPTVLVTIGLLLMARGRWLALLLPIPLLWCLFSGLTLLAMREAQAWPVLAGAGLATVLAALRLAQPASRR
ncbi:DUF6064 family protein [Ancylobacter rudongensis]|uniref:MFS transporter permease n=1 Tax=Ancylobacter rudongensis TaxID=177413 RepID=A0A1G4RWW7_9HYPH|nr:DUF6064 family protein [Ancylobacter rudongensis]SCW61238.1 hypothetical protein SAMN05660859_1992 [Ancylobacter rudongensis]